MLNPFFLQGSQGEQGLVQDLINEQLRMYGLECHYIPRKLVTSRTIMKEVTESRFEQAFPLEAYLMNIDRYASIRVHCTVNVIIRQNKQKTLKNHEIVKP